MRSFETFRYDQVNVTPHMITLQREGEAVVAVLVAHLRGWTYDLEEASHRIFTDALVVHACPTGDDAQKRGELSGQLDRDLHAIPMSRSESDALDEVARAIGNLEDTAQTVIAVLRSATPRTG